MKRTRARLLFVLTLLITLATPASPMHVPPAQAKQECTSPIRVGSWTGTFLRQIKIEGQGGVTIGYIDMEGSVDFEVACDGTITNGRWRAADYLVNEQEDHAEYTIELLTPSIGEDATCVFLVDFVTNNSRVELGEGGRGRILWDGTSTVVSRKCEGTELTLGIMNEILGPSSSGSAPSSFIWQTDEDGWEPSYFISGKNAWQDPLVEQMIQGLGSNGQVVNNYSSWSAGYNFPNTATSTPGKKEDIPIVTGVTQQLEQIFLEKVTPVLNQYTATIDWGKGGPGSVSFQVGNLTVVGDLIGDTASAPIPVDSLPAGNNKLIVTATSAENKTSQPFERIIQVVPVPPWALPSNLDAKTQDTFVLYQSSTPRLLPAQPMEARISVPSFIPYLGGDWGLQPTQFQINLAASSAGGLSNATPTGTGGVGVAGAQFPLTVRSDSFVRTNMTDAGLLFDEGVVKMELPQAQFTRKLGLLQVIPGAGVIFDIPVVGKALKTLDISAFTAALRTRLSGDGKLGVDGADFEFVDGQITSEVEMVIAAGPNFADTIFLQLVGSANGSLTFGLTPTLHATNCSVSASVFAMYGAFGFFGTVPNPPSATQLVSCEQFQAGGFGSLLAAPQQQITEPLRITPRSPSWQPERVPNTPTEASANGVLSATLIENAGAHIATPYLASGPGGRMALAWVSDTPDRARPQSFQTRLRLFDGKAWGPAITISDNTQPDYSPSAAFDAKGQVIVAWVQNKDANLGPNTSLTHDLLKGMEIAYAVMDTQGTPVKSGTLTDDSALDLGPQLAAASDGTVWLAWQSNPNGHLSANSDNRSEIKTARWTGQEWSTPEQAYREIESSVNWHLAAYDAETALIIAAPHAVDSVSISTIERSGSGWAPPYTLATNVTPGARPRAAYSNSEPVVAWSGENGISGLVGDLKATPALWLTDTATLEGLTAGGSGTLALAMSGVSSEGAHALMLSKYDPQAGEWSRPESLVGDWNATSAPAFVGNANGDVAVTYAQPVPTTEDIALPNSETIEVDGMPELANVQLARMPRVLSEASVPGPQTDILVTQAAEGTIWLVAGGAALVVLLLGGVMLLRRRT
ncbi:MAG: hypothetical protein WCD37_10905 [Chloroflexia bacterium]